MESFGIYTGIVCFSTYKVVEERGYLQIVKLTNNLLTKILSSDFVLA